MTVNLVENRPFATHSFPNQLIFNCTLIKDVLFLELIDGEDHSIILAV